MTTAGVEATTLETAIKDRLDATHVNLQDQSGLLTSMPWGFLAH